MLAQRLYELEYFLNSYGITACLIQSILAGVIVIWILFRLLKLFGILGEANLKEQILPRMRILFQTWVGKYENNEQFYHQIHTQASQTFKISKYIGIYYDDPKKIEPANCRSIIGIIVNEGEQSKVQDFLKAHPEYVQVYTPPTKYIGFTLPFINSLSFLVGQNKIYPKLNKLVVQRENVKFSEYCVEIYNNIPKRLGKKQLTILKVIQNFGHFDLWEVAKNKSA